jgi:hypothetical protein
MRLGQACLYYAAVSNPRTAVNEVRCAKCGASLIIECAVVLETLRSEDRSRFFNFTCPVCRGWNAAVQLTGNAINEIRLNLDE